MNPRRNTTEDMEPLARWAGRALGELPEPRAPHDLLAGILERVRRGQPTPWHRKPWVEWPVALRWASAGAAALFLALAWIEGDAVLDAARRAVRGMDAWRTVQEAGSGILAVASACLGAAARAWEHLPRPWFLGVVAALMALWISLLASGAALWRLLRPTP